MRASPTAPHKAIELDMLALSLRQRGVPFVRAASAEALSGGPDLIVYHAGQATTVWVRRTRGTGGQVLSPRQLERFSEIQSAGGKAIIAIGADDAMEQLYGR